MMFRLPSKLYQNIQHILYITTQHRSSLSQAAMLAENCVMHRLKPYLFKGDPSGFWKQKVNKKTTEEMRHTKQHKNTCRQQSLNNRS